MMKKLLLLLMLSIFFISFISAVSYIQSHEQAETSNAVDSMTFGRGVLIKANSNITLTKVTSFPNSVATSIGLFYANGSSIYNATKSGTNATFNHLLIEGNHYVLCNIGQTISAWHDPASYPYNNTYINWTTSTSCDGTWVNQTNVVREFLSITVEPLGAVPTYPTINLTSPINNTNITTSPSLIVTVNSTNASIQLTNVTLFLNGVLNETKTITGTSNITTFSKQAILGTNNWTAYVCDSYNCSLIAGNRSFNAMKIYEENQEYVSSAIESSAQIFKINLSLSAGYSISAINITYNNTNTIATFSSYNSTLYQATALLILPTVSTDTNKTFNWTVLLSDSSTFTSSNKNQTVLNVNLDNCSSYNYTLVNYTLLDELTQTLINNSNSTIESSIILKAVTGETINSFNRVFNGTSNVSICSQSDLIGSGLRLWEQSRYGSTNYVFETHNIQNNSITSRVDIPLLDLPSTSATTFRITYKSTTFLPIKDVIIDIQRKYIGEGTYKSVESPLTDANGQASATFDLNSVTYRILIKQNGTTISTFENPAISCSNILTGDCQINLNERQSVTTINAFDTENDIKYGLTQNNRTIRLTFEIPSLTNRNVTLIVNQSTILGNSTVCVQSLLATSGVIECTVDSTLGDAFTTISVYVDGELLGIWGSEILEDRSEYFGTDNIILTFFLVLSIVLLMISDPIAILFGLIIGLISASLMLLLNSGSIFGTTSVLMYVVIIVIILIIKISMRNRSY